jgi:glycosyltransferase involved in cell wall biosynthesis
MHQVLKALTYIREYYPNVQLRIAGPDITKYRTWREKINISGYGYFLKRLIKNNKLYKQVTFTGILNENKMAEEYRNAHVFICPSSIENSPNSLGEAQMIGTPCVASFVGGIPDMIQDGENGLLYRFDDYVMLAFQVIKIFSSDSLAKTLSNKGRIVAAERHNRELIRLRTIDIYSGIIT